jgi:hypothetical protein
MTSDNIRYSKVCIDPDPSNSARNNSLPRSSPITRKMSKYISNFFAKANQNFNLGEKFKASYNPGSRTFPSKTNKNDADYQMRIDAGEMVGTRRNIVLQVNSQAKATPLKQWIRKNRTHGKLATAYFDTGRRKLLVSPKSCSERPRRMFRGSPTVLDKLPNESLVHQLCVGCLQRDEAEHDPGNQIERGRIWARVAYDIENM